MSLHSFDLQWAEYLWSSGAMHSVLFVTWSVALLGFCSLIIYYVSIRCQISWHSGNMRVGWKTIRECLVRFSLFRSSDLTLGGSDIFLARWHFWSFRAFIAKIPMQILSISKVISICRALVHILLVGMKVGSTIMVPSVLIINSSKVMVSCVLINHSIWHANDRRIGRVCSYGTVSCSPKVNIDTLSRFI